LSAGSRTRISKLGRVSGAKLITGHLPYSLILMPGRNLANFLRSGTMKLLLAVEAGPTRPFYHAEEGWDAIPFLSRVRNNRFCAFGHRCVGLGSKANNNVPRPVARAPGEGILWNRHLLARERFFENGLVRLIAGMKLTDDSASSVDQHARGIAVINGVPLVPANRVSIALSAVR
jgi:hypothetical protein